MGNSSLGSGFVEKKQMPNSMSRNKGIILLLEEQIMWKEHMGSHLVRINNFALVFYIYIKRDEFWTD